MTPVRTPVAAALALLALASAAVGTAPGQAPPPAGDPVSEAGCNRLVDYGAARWGLFSHRIRHPHLPFPPGTRRVFEGRSSVTGAPLPHRVTFTVTGLTKVVDGHRGVVVWDVDETDGEVSEAELAVFAKDRAGNVWNLGEYPEEYEDGELAGAPNTWFAGVGVAEPGIHMPASPAVGLPEYLQGWVADIEFLDCATIVETGASVCVPAGCYQDVIVTHERSPLDPAGGIQVKYHAPQVGIVQIGAIDDPENETLVLTEFAQLTPAELSEANREAHILDQRGRQCNEVYAQTSPVEGPDGGDLGPFTCPEPEGPEPPAPPLPPFEGPSLPAPFSRPAPAPAAAPQPEPAPPARARKARRYRAWVNHPLVPLRRVRTRLYTGREDGERIRIATRVLRKRVRVAGALATAVRVVERENGEVVERSTELFAQDRKGNVWYLGERVAAIEDGKVAGREGTWLAGHEGARRGLYMPARPRVGRTFRQTRAPGVSRDRSRVVALDVSVNTRAGRFTGCLKTRDRDLLSRSRPERKVYCPGVGLVRERASDGRVDLRRYR